MGKIVNPLWHKLALLAIMFYYSAIFTTICLPLMWLHNRMPDINYYIYSFGVLFLGGLIFNTILTNIFPVKEEEIKKDFPKGYVITVFVSNFVSYSLISITIFILTDNNILSLYLQVFLMAGGYFWFCILRGYILAKKDYKESEIDKGIPWKGKVLVFSIPISLILGYFLSH